ncbi:MAG: hypothetical protein NVS9B14_04190 [Candidatus Acidiferrum sp.]
MKRFFFLVVLCLSAVAAAEADSISMTSTCDPSSPTACASPNNIIGGPVSLTVSLGADTLVFLTSAATQVLQGGITSFESFFGNGGGSVQLFDSHHHLIALGTFLPGATSSSDQGGVFATFDGDIAFNYLKGNKLGLSPKDKTGTAHFSYSFDGTFGPEGDTSTYELDINGSPKHPLGASNDINGVLATTAVPEPATLLLLLFGLGALVLTRSLFQAR